MKRHSTMQNDPVKRSKETHANEKIGDELQPDLFSSPKRKLIHDYFFNSTKWSVNGFARAIFMDDPECSSKNATIIWDRSLKHIWETPDISSSQRSCVSKLRELRRAAVAANIVQARQVELERQSQEQANVTMAAVDNFRKRDKHWSEAIARYVGEVGEKDEVAEMGGESYGNKPQAVDDQEDDASEGSSYIPLSSEDNTGGFSIALMEPPKGLVRIVGLGEPSSKLYFPHWIIKNEDISKTLMESRALRMKNHESLQRPEEILQLNFIFTRDVLFESTKLILHTEFPAAHCKPIRCPQILTCISEISLKACCENHSNTKKEWRRLDRKYLEKSEKEHEHLAGLVRSNLEDM